MALTLLRKCRAAVFAAALGMSVVVSTSCRTSQSLPAVDLSSPGWQVQHGQAVWKPTRARPELTGELLLATRPNGDFFAQFSKTPFTLATARMMNPQWRIEFGPGQHAWSGRGDPPERFVWFELPRVLAGESPQHGWRFTRTNELWRIENLRTGESLEGQFFQ